MSNATPVKLAFKVHEPVERGSSSDAILMHGITANKEMWDEIAQGIADKSKRRLYALDMRNHGDSSWSDEFSWKIMADDVLRFMDEHSINSATLIGHSMGGIIAMLIALTRHDKVDAIIVEDIVPTSISEEVRNGIAGRIDLMQRSLESLPPNTDISTALKHMIAEVQKNLPPEMRVPEQHREKYLAIMKTFHEKKGDRIVPRMNAEVLKKFIAASENHKELEGLCQKPALFIYGTISPFKVLDSKDRVLELFPKAEFVAVEGATHLVHTEYPQEFSEAVLKFLNN